MAQFFDGDIRSAGDNVMNSLSPIQAFLAQLRKELRIRPPLAERVIAEAEDHLLETAKRYRERSLSLEEAECEAVARFGTPENIAKSFGSAQNTWEATMTLVLRISVTFLALFTSLICLLSVAHTIGEGEVGTESMILRGILGTVVIVMGVITIQYLWRRGSQDPTFSRIVRLGSVGLVTLGSVVIVDTVRVARITGDWEYYIIMMGMALVCQGMLMLWSPWKQTPREA